MNESRISRRFFLAATAVAAVSHSLTAAADAPAFQIATFTADVTPPIGHALMGGGIAVAAKIVDRLEARGFVLLQTNEKPIVVCAVDWCEIRNDAYDRWRQALADAAGTEMKRVLVTAIHQHDTPIADLTAQKILNEAKARGSICDLKFHEEAVLAVAAALKESLQKPRRITHLGTGEAEVKQIASNRRYLDDAGNPRYDRMSATRDASIRARPEGEIDPKLKTISFFDGDTPVLALSTYATHPMSYYGRGGVSGDFVAMARRQREKDEAGVFQMYVSGCSGNVTAGKYNDGATVNRDALAGRLHEAMGAAWKATKKEPLTKVSFRSTELKLEPREGTGFTAEDLKTRLKVDRSPAGFGQCLAALGISWRQRCEAGKAIDVPVIDFGRACYLVMPAEAYVEYQLAAQKLRPDSFIAVAGYGECGPGYIPIERAWKENDGNLSDWCWVQPGSEKKMMEAMERVLSNP